jgi:hypothetical protein
MAVCLATNAAIAGSYQQPLKRVLVSHAAAGQPNANTNGPWRCCQLYPQNPLAPVDGVVLGP